ncbi:hypothetical protein Nisw_04330 [Candidatus Nitrosopumilus sp. SW]|uniref:TylF/MycF/NovP-related O-methyltransferase n=1 Tax=Candidatus Nitrosopumilus sp. SW TaxID=2508726 RepID=UPI00114EA2A1|nr:TylF/MycF/NovP-related O-methyltransferase [Candidatus Nitrosopumilus sp. SW]QDI88803.1 hypothetical protein Nisw_04330 [Candidatus Nitrosopumilus sp. SW]
MVISKLVIIILKKSEPIYHSLRKKYFKFLPTSPLGSVPLIKKQLFRLKTKVIASNFDPEIQKLLEWYNLNHYDLRDSQEAIDVACFCKFILDTEDIEGDILELGAEYGGFSTVLGHFLKQIKSKRKVISCDTFYGYPYEDIELKATVGEKRVGRYKDLNFEDVQNRIKKYDVVDKVELIQGKFEDTLNQKLSDRKFSIVFIDCNIYKSTKISLEFSYPRLSNNGLVLFDEYEDTNNPYSGETIATNEFCEEHDLKIDMTLIPHIRKI